MSVTVCVIEFKVAVTVRLYVPAGVPFGLVFGPDELPPQEEISISDATMVPRYSPLADRFLHAAGTSASPSRIPAHTPSKRIVLEFMDAVVRDVVATETLKVDAVVPLTVTEEGTEHVAPCGAPAQINDAVPLMSAPPIDRV